ncbi:hypothetical protein GCM10011519_20820 [Marmoricola endophyticus]|uniref:Tetratricopeptide repeat protein n=1 Tax=Marmoricola endophyticus TaxID=2040280 RepID=A0A917F2I6_9ACTN|nr:hypothetical protein [Marmoricola endophyticus]GGF46669.1 hypothetical protein GCM10011519_20820 [Marmoricola endophyticus]
MSSVVEVEQLLRVADALPPGEEQVAAAERALDSARHLEGAAGVGLQVQARINLVAAYDASRPGERELPHIAWLLSALADGDGHGAADVSGVLTDRQRFEILWECRFALQRTRRTTTLPLPLVLRVYADIERRYRAERVSPNLFAKYRALLARDIDDPAVFDRWLSVWRRSPRDELSDCAVCDIATDARFLAEAGDLQGALERARDLLEGRRSCDREPHRLYGEAADWAARLGLGDTAEAYHRAGWLLVAGRPRHASAMADHVMYLLRAGRPGRASRLAQQLVVLLNGPAAAEMDDVERMCAAAVASRVLRAGRGHRIAPPVVDGLALDAAISTFATVGRELAEAFDRRNGTDRVGSRVRELTRIRLHAEGASEEARSYDLLDVALAGGVERTAPPESALPAGALGYAAELIGASDAFDGARVMELIEGWSVDRDHLLPASGTLEHFAVAYLERRSLACERAQRDPAFAEELLESAAASARLSGSQAAAQRVDIDVLHRQAVAGDRTAWSRAEKLVEELVDEGELKEAASGLLTLSRSSDPVRGQAYAERAATLFEQAGQPRWRVTALQGAAYAAVWADPARAVDLLEEAEAEAETHEMVPVAVTLLATRAKLAQQQGDLTTAAQAYSEAVAAADEVGITDPLGLRAELCDVLLADERWEEAIDAAHELLLRAGPADVVRRSLAHRVLGTGLLETGNAHESAEVLEPAVAALAREGSPFLAVTAWALGRALLACERPDLAAEHFATAAEGFRRTDQLPDAAAASEAAGATYARSGRVDEAGQQLVAAARISRHLGDRHRLVSSLRQLAGVQASGGRVTEALSTLGSIIPETRDITPLEPDDPTTRFADPIEEKRLRGLLEHQAAVILVQAGRAEEAVPLARASSALLAEHGTAEDVAQVQSTWAALTER